MQNKAVRIFEYLRELKKLSTTVVWDMSSYGYEPLWIDDIPAAKGVKSAFLSQDVDRSIWLEVKKIKLPNAPTPPATCIDWVKDGLYDDYKISPTLVDTIETDTELKEIKQIVDNAVVQDEFDKYMVKQWKPWAEDYGETLPVYKIYNKLFELHSSLKKEGEKVELILGLGLLVWQKQVQHIRRHLLVTSVQLDFDPVNAVITLRPAIDIGQLSFECDVIQDIIHRDEISKISSMIDECDDICSKNDIDPILQCIANYLPESIYEQTHTYKISFADKPKIIFAPAFYLRKRGEASWLKALNTIINHIKNGITIPENIKILTDSNYTTPQINDNDSGRPITKDENDIIYFPLQANDAQKKIVHKISTSRGVLVQGPPGTGKSHTIANIVCHYLSLGKKVLVTSQTPRALKVLKDKIPSEYQGLCVSILGNDPDAIRNLNDAIAAFNDRYASKIDADIEEKNIEKLKKELGETRQNIVEYRRKMLELSQKDQGSYTFGPYHGSLLEVSKKVASDSDKYTWVPKFEYVPNDKMPEEKDIYTFIEILKWLTSSKIAELSKTWPVNLPDDTSFNRKVHEYIEAKKYIETKRALVKHGHYELIRRSDKVRIAAAYESLKKLESQFILLKKSDGPWVESLKHDVVHESTTKWKAVQTEVNELISYIEAMPTSNELLRGNFINPTNASPPTLLNYTNTALQHCNQHGRLSKIWLILSREGRECSALKKITFNGKSVINCDSLSVLNRYLDIQIRIAETARILKQYGLEISNMPWCAFNEIHEVSEKLSRYLDAVQYITIARINISAIEGTLVPKWDDEQAVDLLQELLLLGLENITLDECDTWFYSNAQAIQQLVDMSNSHSVCTEILRAIKDKSTADYRKAIAKCYALNEEKKQIDWWRSYKQGLDNNRRVLFSYFEKHITDSEIGIKTSDWQNVWHYAAADSFLTFVSSNDIYAKLVTEQSILEKREKSLLCELGAKIAWHKCIQSMKTNEIQHLRAWAQAIRRIGKGTGKYANKHRRDAQIALENCRSAIPAWVMPLYQVVENFKIEPEIFDLVVIDEASQSGPDALILFYLGKKCLVVGDGEQIAPETFVDREKVYSLINEYLYDVPHAHTYEPETSLYSHAQIRYHDEILLNEHFRCMPEIIQFSNDAFYHGRLECLKQYPMNRLTPIETYSIQGGYREDNKKINKNEAKALVDKVIECCEDPRYDSKTMGIISLVGDEQSKYIESLIRQSLDPQEIERRNIICGDAYSFQGDERDIMFISLVADINTGTILTKASDGRRINVASSRSREQTMVFHSFMPSDMSSSSFLQRFLTYCKQPTRMMDETDLETARSLFDSKFEEDVFNRITDRGYHVQPQFKCAGRRIDLVVSGMQGGRIAVECDGDQWHGLDKQEQDMERQRLLERVGWVFWRIRGFEYYRDPEQSMEPLWKILDEYGIKPSIDNAEESQQVITEVVTNHTLEEIKKTNGVSHDERLQTALFQVQLPSQNREIDNKSIECVIIKILRNCPNQTCTKDSIISRVCQQLGIIKRAGPRLIFAKQVYGVVNSLRRKNIIEFYRAKNERLRLLETAVKSN